MRWGRVGLWSLPVTFYKQESGVSWLRIQVLESDDLDLILLLTFASWEILLLSKGSPHMHGSQYCDTGF